MPPAHFVAPNPPFGAVVTYYLKDDLKTRETVRQEQEKAARSAQEAGAFWRRYEAAVREHTAMRVTLTRLTTKVERVARVIEHSRTEVLEIDPRFHELRGGILELEGRLNGQRSKAEPGEKAPPTAGDRLSSVSRGVGYSTHGPTASHRQSLEIATTEMAGLRDELERYQAGLSELVRELIAAGAPWIEGEPLP